MHIKFEHFINEEVRLGDILKTNNEFLNKLKNVEFKSGELVKYFTFYGKKYFINYNHHPNHDIKLRIKERTPLKSVDEFNILIDKALKILFQKHIPENTILDFNNNTFGIYFKEYNFTIILYIVNKRIKISTVIGGKNLITGKNIEVECVI